MQTEDLDPYLPFDPDTWTAGWRAPIPNSAWIYRREGSDPRGRGTCHRDALYRFYDESKQPLYFGVTTGGYSYTRWYEHKQKAWWPLIRYVRITPIPGSCTSLERIEFEKRAIQREKPRHNTIHLRRRTQLTVRLDRGEAAVIEEFRKAMLPEDFAALLEAFHREFTAPDTK